MKRSLKVALTVGGVLCAAVFAMIADVQLRYIDKIFSLDTSPWPQRDSSHFGIVLGASVRSDGTPSPALQDRLDTAAWLHDHGFVGKILLTGDDGAYHANEIDVMKSYVVTQHVPETEILTDGKGYRTYESCKHAKEQGITPAIIVTNRFHLGRALYLCNRMGVDALGVADDRDYTDITFFWARDLLASVKAWWDINVWPPKPPV